MINIFCSTLFVLLFFTSSVRADCLDVYGVDAKEAQALLTQYSSGLKEIARLAYTGLTENAEAFFNSPEAQKLREQRELLLEKIKTEHHYPYVALDTIFYGKDDYCSTLEIVKSGQQDRLRYLSRQAQPAYPKKGDVIDTMEEYLEVGRDLFLSSQIQPKHADCPVYHCSAGFDHPKLKPYLSRFNTAAIQERALILETLKNDPNPVRRTSAAYLAAHFTDPQDIVNVLLPYVNDPDDGVRNSVIRVLSLTTQKANITNLDPTPFLQLLDSPIGTDRNKSLFLLSVLAQSKATKRELTQHAKAPLLAILRLQQPNQHDFAYRILKEISQQDFGPHDEARWAAWFDEQNNAKEQAS